MQKGLLTFLIFGIVMQNALAQNDADVLFLKSIHNQSLTESKCYGWLERLCKEAGPRLAGSEAYDVAVSVGQEILKEAGAVNISLQPCEVKVWKRGVKEVAYYIDETGEKQYLHVLSLGNTIGTGLAGITGKVIEVQSLAEVDNMADASLEGKIVFFNRPMDATQLRTFNAYGGAVDQRGSGLYSAAKKGAVAVLVRSMALANDDFPHTGSIQSIEGAKQVPAMAISTNDANKISAILKEQKELSIFMRNTCHFEGTKSNYSVIGEIKGSEFPNEVIVVGGHLDSWDVGEGAHDDGAGCVHAAQVLQTLNALNYKPKRTIRCVMFANEENGLAGGRAYAAATTGKSEKHIAALESDSGGFVPRDFSFDADTSVFKSYLKKVNTWLPLFESYGLQYKTEGSGADIGPLKPQKTLLIGLRPDSQRYFDHHHTTNDLFSTVHKRELELGAAAMTSLVYMIDKYGLQ